jgi:hypothetical protein
MEEEMEEEGRRVPESADAEEYSPTQPASE